jgi:hypothetical protein
MKQKEKKEKRKRETLAVRWARSKALTWSRRSAASFVVYCGVEVTESSTNKQHTLSGLADPLLLSSSIGTPSTRFCIILFCC